MKFTILGAKGFIGSHLVEYLGKNSCEYFAPERNEPAIFTENLGHVIYSIGLTADFRDKPIDTVDAHVCSLINYLQNTKYESFLYLSSTRVYHKAIETSENSELTVTPLSSGDLYNISKLMGESLCLSFGQSNVRVVRLSNVYGYEYPSVNFLSTLIRDALVNNKIILKNSMASSKDYISINDVVRLLPQIALSGKERIYNVASGNNISNEAIMRQIKNITGCEIEVIPKAKTVIFPIIKNSLVAKEFGYQPSSLLESLPTLIQSYKICMMKSK